MEVLCVVKEILEKEISVNWRQLAFHFQCKTLFAIMIYIDTIMTNVIVQVNYK